MKTLAIIQVELLRTIRDRRTLFFSIVLPFILILVLGLAFGGNSAVRVGVVDGDSSAASRAVIGEITSANDVRVEAVSYATLDDLRDAAGRGLVELGVVIPAGFEANLAAGQDAAVTQVTPPTQASTVVKTMVDRAIARENARYLAARFAATTTELSAAQALEIAAATQDGVAGVTVSVETVGAPATRVNGFDAGAQSQLILFMFLTALTGAASLVSVRKLGIARRMFATPTPVHTIIVGEAAARTFIALLQALLIVFLSSALFGVSWGDWLATASVVLAFSLVSAGAAMLVGSLVANESQAGALGPALGMLLALVGGAMVPAEVFPEMMRTLSWLTPHAWAMDALVTLRGTGHDLMAILPQLGVLLLFAVVLLGLATLRLRRVLATG
jgi:ABC-2 type transport system permease protein